MTAPVVTARPAPSSFGESDPVEGRHGNARRRADSEAADPGGDRRHGRAGGGGRGRTILHDHRLGEPAGQLAAQDRTCRGTARAASMSDGSGNKRGNRSAKSQAARNRTSGESSSEGFIPQTCDSVPLAI